MVFNSASTVSFISSFHLARARGHRYLLISYRELRCLRMWSHDRTLLNFLELAKTVVRVVDVLNGMWPSACECPSVLSRLWNVNPRLQIINDIVKSWGESWLTHVLLLEFPLPLWPPCQPITTRRRERYDVRYYYLSLTISPLYFFGLWPYPIYFAVNICSLNQKSYSLFIDTTHLFTHISWHFLNHRVGSFPS